MLVKALLLGAKLSTIADSIHAVIHLSYLTKINNSDLAWNVPRIHLQN